MVNPPLYIDRRILYASTSCPRPHCGRYSDVVFSPPMHTFVRPCQQRPSNVTTLHLKSGKRSRLGREHSVSAAIQNQKGIQAGILNLAEGCSRPTWGKKAHRRAIVAVDHVAPP